MKHLSWKQIFNLAGLCIGIAGVVFVVMKLVEYAHQIDLGELTLTSFILLAGLILVYFSANFLLAFAWRNLLQFLGVKTTLRWAVQTYGISQIGKYVPGNIFHFAGRQAIGQSAGIPPKPLAKSSVWEIGLLAVTGSLFFLLVLPLFIHQIAFQLAAVLFFLVLIIFVALLHRLAGSAVASAGLYYILFLVISGLIFNGLLLIVGAAASLPVVMFIEIAGVYVVAWLAGLVTPGAPAGLGVRELVFLTILHGVIGEKELLEAIVLGRIVTVGGDVLYYLFAMFMRYGKGGEGNFAGEAEIQANSQ